MLKLPTSRVNKIMYDGPKGFSQIVKAIEEDAKAEGMDHINENVIQSVIRYVFSEKGALLSIFSFHTAYVHGFGRWVPNIKKKNQRARYYVEWKKYRIAFRKQVRKNRALIARYRKQYEKYLKEEIPEIKMSFKTWLRSVEGRKIINDEYKKLNKMRSDFMKREKEFDYMGINVVKKKFKRK